VAARALVHVDVDQPWPAGRVARPSARSPRRSRGRAASAGCSPGSRCPPGCSQRPSRLWRCSSTRPVRVHHDRRAGDVGRVGVLVERRRQPVEVGQGAPARPRLAGIPGSWRPPRLRTAATARPWCPRLPLTGHRSRPRRRAPSGPERGDEPGTADLAGRGPGELVDDQDRFGTFARDTSARGSSRRTAPSSCGRPRDDGRDEPFAPLLVGHAERDGLGDALQAEQGALHLGGVDVDPAADDEVARPSLEQSAAPQRRAGRGRRR
jgi:hypothetical protein